jgi:DDE superfamily endonuclease
MTLSLTFLLILLAVEIQRRKRGRDRFQHSRLKKIFYRQLSPLQRTLRDRRIPRSALQDPANSAWRVLFTSGNNQALITLTGLNFETFGWLLERFEPIYESHSPFISHTGRIVPIQNPGRGRKRLMAAEDCLGLVLAWTRTRGTNMVLQLIFGMTGTPVSMYLRFARRVLIRVLVQEPDSAIRIPDNDTIVKYQEAVKERHPALQNVWCTMDGLKILLQQSGDTTIQNNYYNGWTHDHYVSAVIVFCPDGTIPAACYNVPGCVHDSTIAEWGNLYSKLERVYESPVRGKCTVDSAFCKKRCLFLIKSQQADPDAGDADAAEIIEAKSMRQSAEWGMRSFQSSFPRLKDRFIYEEFGERRIIMKMCLLLYNLRARRVGINQIRNTYMPALNVNANEMFVGPLI